MAKGAHFYLPTGLIIFGILTILGLIAFICRIFDAVTDPWIASLSDRSTNPKGRRIPFMKRAAVPFALIAVLVFFAPVDHVSGVNIAWVLCSLILFYLFMTMYCTPYNALISEFGKTQEDRMYISTAISLTFFFGSPTCPSCSRGCSRAWRCPSPGATGSASSCCRLWPWCAC